MSKHLYFAYGSNLNADDLRNWCMRKGLSSDFLKFLSVGYLPDCELVFNHYSFDRKGGVLNLRERTGQLTEGVIFEVSEEGWEILDKKEGAPGCYERRDVTALTPDGEEIEATTYIVPPERCRKGFVAPTEEYLRVVREGLAAFGLSDRALNAAARDETLKWEVDGLFIYGTLQRGERAFALLEPFRPRCILLAEASGRLIDRGAYPGMIPPGSDGDRVQGEFVRLRDIGRTLRHLDEYESFRGFGQGGSLFRRTLITVDVGDGRLRQAWCYVLAAHADEGEVILSGDWREHLGRREAFLRQLVAAHAGGNEEPLARELVKNPPYSFGHDAEAVARELLPLFNAVSEGRISERRLAQVSGSWATIPA